MPPSTIHHPPSTIHHRLPRVNQKRSSYLYSTGMRQRELVNLNRSDFAFERAELLIVNPKDRKNRLVPVGEAGRRYTEAYRRLLRPWMVCSQQEKALFVSHRGGGRLSLRSVSEILLNAAQASGVTKRISPHSFRHDHASVA